MNRSGAAVSSRHTQKEAQTFKDLFCRPDNKAFHRDILDIIHALQTRACKKNKIIPFPEAFRIFSWWKVRKEERFDVLGALQQAGYLRIVKGHGIVLQKTKKMTEQGFFCQDLNIFLGFRAVCNEAECRFSISCNVPGNRVVKEEL